MATSIQLLLIRAIDVFFYLIELLIFIRIILSWIPMFGYQNPIGQLIYRLTEPILGPCRSMLDKSPIIALILMMLVKQLLTGLVLLF